MWSWDQGRLSYFHFDNLKKIAKFALFNDLKLTDRKALVAETGLPFPPNNDLYPPWRNYSRVFGLSLICAKHGTGSSPTKVAQALAADGVTTTDEYFHFLCEATTDPSPVLQGWDHSAELRYPLLFCLKYLLARATLGKDTTSISEMTASYEASGFSGEEDQTDFIRLVGAGHNTLKHNRQAEESIRVIAQISYLSLDGRNVTVSLSKDDATNLFQSLAPITGTPKRDGAEEIFRITDLFDAAVGELRLDYTATVMGNVEEAGFSATKTFAEGAKARKTHLAIERNRKIRDRFFTAYPTTVCDICDTDTAHDYPWTPRILDVHHLLPLCSGARTSKTGTVLRDLVAVCPTCHRGVHSYYDAWLKTLGQKDFLDAEQARTAYEEAKKKYKAAILC